MMHFAHADYIETEEEKELFLSKIYGDTFRLINKEFNKNNDFIRFQKTSVIAKIFDYIHENKCVIK